MPEAIYYGRLLLESLRRSIRMHGLEDDLCAVMLAPGAQVAADYGTEACGGMAWVQLTSAAPTVTFPTPASSPDNCAYTLLFSFNVGILRPVAMPEVFGEEVQFPEDSEMTAAAEQQYRDLHLIHEAIKGVQSGVGNMVLGTYAPIGPEGAVVGGSWDVTVGDE